MNRRRALMSAASSGPAPVHGTWEDLFARIADGTYATAYSVGEILPLDLGAQGNVGAQIAAFNTDDKADNSGKAAVTFITQHVLNSSHRINPSLSPSSAPYTDGTGGIGGWEKCEMRAYLKNTIKPLFPSVVRNRIVEVTKKSFSYDTSGNGSYKSSTEDVWLPGSSEVLGDYAQEGVRYSDLFGTAGASAASTMRVKTKTDGTTAVYWWLRTATSTTKFRMISTNGNSSYYNAQNAGYYVVVGFCID